MEDDGDMLPAQVSSDEESESDEETDSDTNDEYDFGEVSLDREPGPFRQTKHLRGADHKSHNGGLPNFLTGDYDRQTWFLTRKGGYVKMEHTNGSITSVPVARVNKALRALSVPELGKMVDAQAHSNCSCKRHCSQHVTTSWDVYLLRRRYLQQADEFAATQYLADLVRSSQPDHARCSEKNKEVWTGAAISDMPATKKKPSSGLRSKIANSSPIVLLWLPVRNCAC